MVQGEQARIPTLRQETAMMRHLQTTRYSLRDLTRDAASANRVRISAERYESVRIAAQK